MKSMYYKAHTKADGERPTFDRSSSVELSWWGPQTPLVPLRSGFCMSSYVRMIVHSKWSFPGSEVPDPPGIASLGRSYVFVPPYDCT
jgi:hypothetical protein